MKDNITPEEKLLRLIRKDKKIDAPTGQKFSRAGLAIKRWRVGLTIKSSFFSLIQKSHSFLNPQRIILIAFAASCLYLIINLIYPLVGLRVITLPKVAQEKNIELKERPTQEPKPYEFYLEGIKERQIFTSPQAQGVANPQSGLNSDLLKDISLVGIISGENPQAVIEDKKTQKTFYLNKGQFFGELQVEDIQEGRVIINYRGERFELYL